MAERLPDAKEIRRLLSEAAPRVKWDVTLRKKYGGVYRIVGRLKLQEEDLVLERRVSWAMFGASRQNIMAAIQWDYARELGKALLGIEEAED